MTYEDEVMALFKPLGPRCLYWRSDVPLPEFYYYTIEHLGSPVWVNRDGKFGLFGGPKMTHQIYIQHDIDDVERVCEVFKENYGHVVYGRANAFVNGREYSGIEGTFGRHDQRVQGPEYCIGYRPSSTVGRLGSFQKTRSM